MKMIISDSNLKIQNSRLYSDFNVYHSWCSQITADPFKSLPMLNGLKPLLIFWTGCWSFQITNDVPIRCINCVAVNAYACLQLSPNYSNTKDQPSWTSVIPYLKLIFPVTFCLPHLNICVIFQTRTTYLF